MWTKLLVEMMLDGTFLGCHVAIPRMTEGGGAIINMASIAGLMGISAIPAYSGAKAGIIGMTRSIVIHCRERGYAIRCNAIAPGGIARPMTVQAVAEPPDDDPGRGQDDLLGDRGRNGPGKAIDAARGRDQAARHFRQAEGAVFRRDDHVARQRQFATAGPAFPSGIDVRVRNPDREHSKSNPYFRPRGLRRTQNRVPNVSRVDFKERLTIAHSAYRSRYSSPWKTLVTAVTVY